MTWSKFDDGYDEHEKVEDAWFSHPPNPVGLHVQATTACNRWLSNGVIRPRWLAHKLSHAKNKAKFHADMVTCGLFDALPAGDTITVTDSGGNTITLGPYEEDRFVVHDFLDRHDSSVQVKDRRRRDAERKTGRKQTESVRNPDGIPADSSPSRARGRAGALPRPDPTLPNNPPSPPRGDRLRDRREFKENCAAYAAEHFPDIEQGAAAVVQATTYGKATTHEQVAAFIDEHFREPNTA